jgi:CRP-like cAMP-binding protein
MMTTGTEITSCAGCPIGRTARGTCCFVTRHRQAGDYLAFQDQPVTSVWFIKRGSVALLRSSGAGDQLVGVRGPASLLGVESLARDGYASTARALEDVDVCRASREAFDVWLGPADAPARTVLALTQASQAADVPRGAAVDGSAVGRVARWLLDESHPKHIPRRLLATLLGMAPETLSRALARLARHGAVDLTRTQVAVRDRDLLQALSA